RLGGLSEVPFASLNCGLHVGDEQTIVVNNRKRLAESAGFDFNTWTSAEQIHGNRVAIVDHKKIGRGREHYGDAIENADALVSNVMNVTLTAVFADCVPLYFWDPVGKVIGIAHAGWQGTVQRIAEKTIE